VEFRLGDGFYSNAGVCIAIKGFKSFTSKIEETLDLILSTSLTQY